MLRCTKGNVAMITAIASVPLVLAAGAALDYAKAMRDEVMLQAAVDSAALAVAADEAGIKMPQEQAQAVFDKNAMDSGCPSTVSVSIDNNQVTVDASCKVKTTLMRVANINHIDVAARAVAIRAKKARACLIALHGSDKESVMVNSDSAIVAPACELHLNSSNAEALRGNSNGDITSKKTCLVGGWTADASSQFSPKPEACPSIVDPLANLPVPSEAAQACDFESLKVTGKKTLNPGVYCNKLEIDSGAEITFSPGIYVVRDGEFIVNSMSKMKGDDVMLYLTGSNNTRLNVNSGSHIELRAPRTGTYAGVAIYQERGIKNADFSILNSDSTSFVEGVIYLPSTPLHLNSYGALSPSSPWTVIISSKVEVNSHSKLQLNADYEKSSVPLPAAFKSAMGIGMVRLKN